VLPSWATTSGPLGGRPIRGMGRSPGYRGGAGRPDPVALSAGLACGMRVPGCLSLWADLVAREVLPLVLCRLRA